VADRADGDRLLLHRFEQRSLRLGRGAVDLVSQDQIGEDRTRLKLEGASAALGCFEQDVGAQDVRGHQVRRELDAAVVQLQRSSDRAHQQGLAQTRQAFEQDVPARQQRMVTPQPHLLADDDARHLAFERLGRLAHTA
jgi:hypothetical protein